MRMMSYNIHKGIGGRDRRYRLERIIRVIEEENPDLICLQEVDRHVARTRHDDQPQRLAEALEATADLYQLNVRLKSGGYGNLVLSRWPFESHHQISLRRKRRKPRGARWRSSGRRRVPCTWSTGTWAWPRASGTGKSGTCSTTPSSTSRPICRR